LLGHGVPPAEKDPVGAEAWLTPLMAVGLVGSLSTLVWSGVRSLLAGL